MDAESVRREVRAWLEANWDPNLSLLEWRDRLADSGWGCPTWPTCEEGSLVPRGATGAHGWIEFLNRMFTGVVSVAVALAAAISTEGPR